MRGMDVEVAVLGSANMDLVFKTPKLPSPGETVLGLTFEMHAGGKGANQAVAASRLGARAEFLGAIGRDEFGLNLRSALLNAGVDLSGMAEHPSAATGCAAICVDESGQNQIVVAPGANAGVDADRVASRIRGRVLRAVLASCEVPFDAIHAAFAAAGPGTLRILNPAPAGLVPSDVWRLVDVATPNEHEAEALTGVRPRDAASRAEAARRIRDLGARIAVITLGPEGAYFQSDDDDGLIPSIPVGAVDTTGAGDAFNGALAVFLAEGRPLADAVGLANRVGALSTTKPGAIPSMPDRAALRAVVEPPLAV